MCNLVGYTLHNKMIKQKLAKILKTQPHLIKNGVIYAVEKPGYEFIERNPDVLINRLKVFFKKYPALFDFIHLIVGASRVGLSPKAAIADLGQDKVVLNLGSGTKIIRKDVINVDFYPFRNVNVVADVAELPFKDNSVDVVICESLLEHLREPERALSEMKRVLKPGGLIYVTVPFVAGFHSSPDDLYRWSKKGLRELMKKHGFKEGEIGVRCGPTSAVLSVVNDWFAGIFSFGFSAPHQIILMLLTIITSPLKIIDHLIFKLKTSQNIAFAFYYLGKKGL